MTPPAPQSSRKTPDEDAPECTRCNSPVNLRENTEHTGLCDSCAQQLVGDCVDVLRQRDEARDCLLAIRNAAIEKSAATNAWANAQEDFRQSDPRYIQARTRYDAAIVNYGYAWNGAKPLLAPEEPV